MPYNHSKGTREWIHSVFNVTEWLGTAYLKLLGTNIHFMGISAYEMHCDDISSILASVPISGHSFSMFMATYNQEKTNRSSDGKILAVCDPVLVQIPFGRMGMDAS